MNIKSRKTKNILILTLVIILILVLMLWLYYIKASTSQKSIQQTSTPNLGDDVNKNDGNSVDTSNQSNSNNSGQSSSSTPDKPILSKSSGNNGSVPANIIVEFVCQGTAGLNCKIILVNQNNSTVELPNQQVNDNGRGQYFTSWEWKSQSGSWQVYAVSTNQQGKSTQSDKQTLEVR